MNRLTKTCPEQNNGVSRFTESSHSSLRLQIFSKNTEAFIPRLVPPLDEKDNGHWVHGPLK